MLNRQHSGVFKYLGESGEGGIQTTKGSCHRCFAVSLSSKATLLHTSTFHEARGRAMELSDVHSPLPNDDHRESIPRKPRLANTRGKSSRIRKYLSYDLTTVRTPCTQTDMKCPSFLLPKWFLFRNNAIRPDLQGRQLLAPRAGPRRLPTAWFPALLLPSPPAEQRWWTGTCACSSCGAGRASGGPRG